jgi:hypothetical protein
VEFGAFDNGASRWVGESLLEALDSSSEVTSVMNAEVAALEVRVAAAEMEAETEVEAAALSFVRTVFSVKRMGDSSFCGRGESLSQMV